MHAPVLTSQTFPGAQSPLLTQSVLQPVGPHAYAPQEPPSQVAVDARHAAVLTSHSFPRAQSPSFMQAALHAVAPHA
jgi:hypothetical protein